MFGHAGCWSVLGVVLDNGTELSKLSAERVCRSAFRVLVCFRLLLNENALNRDTDCSQPRTMYDPQWQPVFCLLVTASLPAVC